jgi:cell volume regulation protein A
MATLFLVASFLILLSLAIARFFEDFGVPSLLLFMAIGLLAGKEGFGGMAFADVSLAQGIGVFSLIVILFSGGLSTHWGGAKPYLKQAIALSTLGVLITAGAVATFAHAALGFPWLQGLLLGAIISSTDAAAVFASLRSRKVVLHPGLRSLLELESGSNDPIAVFLTVSFLHLITHPNANPWLLLPDFFWQSAIGAVWGIAAGRGAVWVANHAKFPYEGFYMVFFLAAAVFIYGGAEAVHGSGFLAVYVAAIAIGSQGFVQKKSVLRFYDGLTWLAQIGMFLALGLLVSPSQLPGVVPQGLALAAFLMFIARPLASYLCLWPTAWNWREKAFLSWVGLRGAVPIVLATYLLTAGLPEAPRLFNLVFFIVVASALLQGWSVSAAARLLRVGNEGPSAAPKPLELTNPEGSDTELEEFLVPFGSMASGMNIAALGLPPEAQVVLMGRNGEFLVPTSSSVLDEGDSLMVLADKETKAKVQALLSRQRQAPEKPKPPEDEPSHWFG